MTCRNPTTRARLARLVPVVLLALGTLLLAQSANAGDRRSRLVLDQDWALDPFNLGVISAPRTVTSLTQTTSPSPLPPSPDAVNLIITWNGTTNNIWSTGTNWSSGVPPGSGDTAQFNNAGNGNTTISLTSAVTTNTLLFDTSSAAAYTIGSGAVNSQSLILNASGAIQVTSTVTNNQLFNVAITLDTAKAGPNSFTFLNDSTTATLTIAGNVAPSAAGGGSAGTKTLTLSGSGNGLISGTITGDGSGSNATIAITKSGTGTWTLAGGGTNTYAGATMISAGILNIQKASALGGTTVGTTVSSGATLQLQGGITFAAEALNIGGIGASGQNGALVNVSGTNNYAGLLTLSAATTISSDSGTLNLTNTGTITGATFGLTLTGAGNGSISSAIGTTTGTLTKNGAGTWTLSGSGANTYTGLTTVNAGELDLNKTAGTNAIGGNLTIGDGTGTDTVKLLAANQIADTATVTMDNAGGVFDLNGNAETIGGLSGVASGASITLGSATLTVNQSGTTSFAGVISGTGGLTKSGAGSLTLSAANTYSGTTTASAGTLILTGTNSSSGAVTVTSGTLQLGSGTNGGMASGTLSLGSGTIRSTDAGARTISNPVIFTGATTFGASSTGALTFNGTVDLNGATRSYTFTSDTTFTNVVSSSTSSSTTGLTKAGGGTLTFSGSSANTYGGTTTVNVGELDLNKTAGVNAIAGAISIGDGTSTDTVKLLASDQIIDTSDLTLFASGTPVFNLNGFSETIDGLISTNSAASVSLGSGTLTVGANNETSATFAGVISGSGGSVVKTGNGTQILSGVNTYTGGTTLNGAGILQGDSVANTNTLSSFGSGTITLNSGTLQLRANPSSGSTITVSNSVVVGGTTTINVDHDHGGGGGTGNTFAMGTLSIGAFTLNVTGASSYALSFGATTLTGAATFNPTSAKLTLASATIGDSVTTGTTTNLTLDGTFGTTGTNPTGSTITGVISDNATDSTKKLALVKSNTGTWILSGANTYSGGTTVSNGLLVLQGSGTLGSTTALLTINGSGKLDLFGTNQTVGGLTGNASPVGVENNNTGTTSIFTIGNGTTISDSFTYSGVIDAGSGAVALVKTGAGTQILSGANTYTGGTTISGGTLQIGAGGTSGTLGTGTGGVVDNATLAFNRSDTLTVANAISGTGVVNQIGTGTTVFTGSNSYAGTTTISNGTLQIGNGGTSGTLGSGAVTNNAALSFNRSDAVSVSNLISGSGSVSQIGSGTTTLTANNNYTGATNVNAGKLFINGDQTAATGAVTVSNSGSVLGGTGTIGGAITVNSGAAILGGTGSTGQTLTVGNLTMNSGSFVQLALGPSLTHSTLALTGSYSFQSNQQFQFINLGATTGTYDNIITGTPTDPGVAGWQFDNSFNPQFAGHFEWDGSNVDLVLIAVPEPSTWAAASLALVALLIHQRRRLKRILNRR